MRIQIKVRDTISSLEVSADCSLRDVYEMAGVSQDMSVRVNGISVATEDLDKPLKELGVQEDDRIEFSSPKTIHFKHWSANSNPTSLLHLKKSYSNQSQIQMSNFSQASYSISSLFYFIYNKLDLRKTSNERFSFLSSQRNSTFVWKSRERTRKLFYN